MTIPPSSNQSEGSKRYISHRSVRYRQSLQDHRLTYRPYWAIGYTRPTEVRLPSAWSEISSFPTLVYDYGHAKRMLTAAEEYFKGRGFKAEIEAIDLFQRVVLSIGHEETGSSELRITIDRSKVEIHLWCGRTSPGNEEGLDDLTMYQEFIFYDGYEHDAGGEMLFVQAINTAWENFVKDLEKMRDFGDERHFRMNYFADLLRAEGKQSLTEGIRSEAKMKNWHNIAPLEPLKGLLYLPDQISEMLCTAEDKFKELGFQVDAENVRWLDEERSADLDITHNECPHVRLRIHASCHETGIIFGEVSSLISRKEIRVGVDTWEIAKAYEEPWTPEQAMAKVWGDFVAQAEEVTTSSSQGFGANVVRFIDILLERE